jgi:hypothetical protein
MTETSLQQKARERWWLVLLEFAIVAAVFVAHIRHHGATGMIENIWNGLLLGGIYLASGRNLAVPVIAHAFADTSDFILIYLGKYPG